MACLQTQGLEKMTPLPPARRVVFVVMTAAWFLANEFRAALFAKHCPPSERLRTLTAVAFSTV